MTILHPWALLGLLAAAVPLLLHLIARHQPPERSFPAVRYLEDATRDQRRRLRLRDLLLLILRTVLIVAVVLAAAGVRLTGRVPFGSHPPMAAVVILDNSASSAVIVDGVPLLDRLVATAGRVIERATADDQLWLILADGIIRPGSRAEQLALLAEVEVDPRRLDLTAARRQADALIAASGRTGEIVVVSDGQRSALSTGTGEAPVVVLRPEGPAPLNRAITRLAASEQPWRPPGGEVMLSVVAAPGDSSGVPLRLGEPNGTGDNQLVVPGQLSVTPIALASPGWHLIEAALPADEFRIDDQRLIAVRVAPAPVVSWDDGDSFVAAALEVLQADGRVQRGPGIAVGRLAPAASLLWPPDDPALLGRLNRALAARGATWRFGGVVSGTARADSGRWLSEPVAVTRRVSLEPEGGARPTEVIATVNGEPWIVASGDLILIGSRPEPAWTDLPVRAAWLPLLDGLITRVVEGAAPLEPAVVGMPFDLPAAASRLIGPGGEIVPGDGPWQPPRPGVYWVMAGADTLAAFTASIDQRESALVRADDATWRSSWPGVTLAELTDGAEQTFLRGGRGDLRVPLLILALLAAVAEAAVAGRITRLR